MGLISRLGNFGKLARMAWGLSRADESTNDALMWSQNFFSVPSVTGVNINQATALNVSAVLACITVVSEDFSKLPARLKQKNANGSSSLVEGHFLSDLLEDPNEWQNWMEFCEQMMVGLMLRGNAYAVIIRNYRGVPLKFVPVNPDWVALWESPDGQLFYRVTVSGLHLRAQLAEQPFLIPFTDMLHVRGFSMNGLLGASRIVLAKEAIGLAIAQEQTAARWMSNSARPSGMFTTEQKLTEDASDRLAKRIKETFSGLQNSGKIMVGEQGLKYEKFALTASDIEFIASRGFQLQEVARLFRVPGYMIGVEGGARTTGTTMVQLAQEYVNYTISGYATRWARKLRSQFGLRSAKMYVDFDYSELARADVLSRYNAYRIGIMSSFLKPNEARLDDDREPDAKGNKLLEPQNMSVMGSQSSGAGAGDGRPNEGEMPTDQTPPRHVPLRAI